MARNIIINTTTLIVSIIISFLLLELALRIYNPVVQTVKGDTVVLTPNYDEVREHASTPGLAPESHIHQNSLGFRGAEPPADFADWLTLVTVGGSTTRSAMQSDDVTWTALLGQAVARCFDRSWINNAGMDGHTSIAHIQLIRNYIDKLRPKVVLLLIGANELDADGLFANASQGQTMRRDLPPLGAGGLVTPHEGGITRSLKDLLLQSEVVDLGLTLYRSYRARQLGFTKLEGTTDMPPYGEAVLTAAKHVQPAYAERLQAMIGLLREQHTIPILLTQPTFGGIGRDPTTGSELSRLWFGLFWYRAFETYNDTMRRVAADRHVELIDLARLMPKDTKYYIDPMHYTDAGSKEMAQLIAAALLPYLKEQFPSFGNGQCRSAASP